MVASILITAAVLFASITVILLFKFYFTDRRRMTSFTTGQVLRADETTTIDRDMRRTRTKVTARYRASGKDFEVQTTLDGAKAKLLPPGHPIPVRYNPGEPDMSELVL